MMLGVLQSNRENVLNALSGFQGHLTEIQSALANEDYATLEDIMPTVTNCGFPPLKNRNL